MKKMNNKGFTIVELVIVIAVIAILAAVMIPTFSGIVGKAQLSAELQKVTAAYKEALAEELTDGDFDGQEIPVGNYKFVISATGSQVTGVTVTPVTATGYTTYTYDAAKGTFTIS